MNIGQFKKGYEALIKQARKRLSAPKPSSELPPIPAEHRNPKSGALVYQDEPFPQYTICKRCQLEPVANFFGVCFSCRQLEKTKQTKRRLPRYVFR